MKGYKWVETLRNATKVRSAEINNMDESPSRKGEGLRVILWLQLFEILRIFQRNILRKLPNLEFDVLSVP